MKNLTGSDPCEDICFGLINDEYSIGTFCYFLRSGKKDNKISVNFKGVQRLSVTKMTQSDPYLKAEVEFVLKI